VARRLLAAASMEDINPSLQADCKFSLELHWELLEFARTKMALGFHKADIEDQAKALFDKALKEAIYSEWVVGPRLDRGAH
jgi:hypothetical protein